MKRNLFRFSSALLAALAVTACTDDPTEAFRQGATQVVTSLSYVEILIADSAVVVAQTHDAQGNALSALPEVTSANPAVASVNIDTVISGKPSPETQFSILANGYGTTTVTATTGGLSTDISVQTWPAMVVVTGTGLGGQVTSGTAVQLTGTPVGTDGVAITGPNPIEVYFTSGDAATATVDSATGLATTFSPGLASFTATTITGRAATGNASFEVVPQVFAGTTSATQGTGGQLITITQAAGGPAFDANTAVRFVPDDITKDPANATITSSTATSLTFGLPTSYTPPVAGSVVLTKVGAADVSQAFDLEIVNAFPFTGVVPAAATVADQITITPGAIPWDGDEEFVIGGTDVAYVISQSAAGATIVVPNPAGGADGSAVDIIINNQGPAQIQGIATAAIAVSEFVPPNNSSGTAIDITAGPFPMVIYTSVSDAVVGGDAGPNPDAWWALSPAGDTDFTATMEWDNGADYDLIWIESDGSTNCDACTGANPESASITATGGSTVYLIAEMWDTHGNGATLLKVTITSP